MIKYIFVSLFLITSRPVMTQDMNVDKEIAIIDSLIDYNVYGEATHRVDSLLSQLNQFKFRRQYNAYLLELKYRQVVLRNRQESVSEDFFTTINDLIDDSIKATLPSLTFRLCLMMALSYELVGDLELTDVYLKKAYKIYETNKFEELYSRYCIRVSSFHRFNENLDSAEYYAHKAFEYATKYNIMQDKHDSYILLGAVASQQKKYAEALEYNFWLLDYARSRNVVVLVYGGYISVAKLYVKLGEPIMALGSLDSIDALYPGKEINRYINFSYFKIKSEIYEILGNRDSAYHYFKKYHNEYNNYNLDLSKTNTKKVEATFQNEKNLTTIRNMNLQRILIFSILTVVVGASFLLYRKNRFINHQNKIIGEQLDELTRMLEQKQMLLSELQHRVKNNLSHVISMLEIQKESVDFNNVEELLRSNQNRIHSMALLHKKLSVTEDVHSVQLERYITELAQLVRDSYNKSSKKVKLSVKCDIEKISIEKALPLGLIIVELVSNSMKHAFKKINNGEISIEFNTGEPKKMQYSDNGLGYDFNKISSKGLGQEIIKGLIDQLYGTIETPSSNGFMLIVYFK